MRGRDKKLIRLRNEALLFRYYYWTEERRIRFDDALRILSECEFFISGERIMAIVRAGHSMLDDIRAARASQKKIRGQRENSGTSFFHPSIPSSTRQL
jgi:hypothetical protein